MIAKIDDVINKNFPGDKVLTRVWVRSYKMVGYSLLSLNFSWFPVGSSEFVVTDKHLFLDVRKAFLINSFLVGAFVIVGFYFFGFFELLNALNNGLFRTLGLLIPMIWEVYFLLIGPILIFKGLDGVLVFDRDKIKLGRGERRITIKGKEPLSMGVNILSFKFGLNRMWSGFVGSLGGTSVNVELKLDR